MSKIILDVCEWDPNKSVTIGGVEVKASELARTPNPASPAPDPDLPPRPPVRPWRTSHRASSRTSDASTYLSSAKMLGAPGY